VGAPPTTTVTTTVAPASLTANDLVDAFGRALSQSGFNGGTNQTLTTHRPLDRWVWSENIRLKIPDWANAIATQSWTTVQARVNLMDPKVRTVIQERLDMLDISEPQFQFLGDRTHYHRESWTEMSHEKFFRLLSIAFEIPLSAYPIDRTVAENKQAVIQEEWSHIPGNTGWVDAEFIQGVQMVYLKCEAIMPTQFVPTFGNAKTEEQCIQYDREYAAGQAGTLPPPPSHGERQEAFKLWNVVCKAMLDRAIKDRHQCGLLLMRMCFEAGHDPSGMTAPKLHRFCDYYERFKQAYVNARGEGKKNFKVGLVLTNGVLTRDDYAALAREGNAYDPPPRQRSSAGGGGGGHDRRRESSSKGESRSQQAGQRHPPKPSSNPSASSSSRSQQQQQKPQPRGESHYGPSSNSDYSRGAPSDNARVRCKTCGKIHPGRCRDLPGRIGPRVQNLHPPESANSPRKRKRRGRQRSGTK
jgi:hypothetical protein